MQAAGRFQINVMLAPPAQSKCHGCLVTQVFLSRRVRTLSFGFRRPWARLIANDTGFDGVSRGHHLGKGTCHAGIMPVEMLIYATLVQRLGSSWEAARALAKRLRLPAGELAAVEERPWWRRLAGLREFRHTA
jgi:hypothetical protein